eukprot:5146414-Pyramimonas_sp.AAC.1
MAPRAQTQQARPPRQGQGAAGRSLRSASARGPACWTTATRRRPLCVCVSAATLFLEQRAPDGPRR